MYDSFFVALKVVFPMALLMGTGMLLRRGGVIDRVSMRSLDKISFQLFMPTLLFINIYDIDFSKPFGGKLFVFSFIALMIIFATAEILPKRLVANHDKAAVIGQAMIRSNYILFGIAVCESIYGKGNAGTAALLGTLVVPLTNALAAIILEINRSGKAKPGRLLLSIIKNPMVTAALLALGFKTLNIVIPDMTYSVIENIAGVTTTLAFISLGVSLDLGELHHNRGPLTIGVLLRMIAIPAIFLPISVLLGFRGQELCTLMILFAAPAAVASYPMAVAMGADGQLAGHLVCCTTVVSVFTVFAFTFVFQSLGML